MHYISGGERNLGQGQAKKSKPIWSDNFLTVSLLTIIVWWNPSKKGTSTSARSQNKTIYSKTFSEYAK